MKLLVGQGMNHFIEEWNDHRTEDLLAEGLVDDNAIIESHDATDTSTLE